MLSRMIVDREVGLLYSDFYLFTVVVKLLASVIRIIMGGISLIESALEANGNIY